MKSIFSLVLVYFFCSIAVAHPLDLGIIELGRLGRTTSVRLEMNPRVAAGLLKIDETALTSDAATQARKLFDETLASGTISIGTQPCAWSDSLSMKIEGPQLLSLTTSCANQSVEGSLSVSLPYLKKLPATYNLLVKIRSGQSERISGLDPQHTMISFDLARKSALSFKQFLMLGLAHVGMQPNEWLDDQRNLQLPLGRDHILFVIALLLSGGGWRELLKVVTGFTLGHTLSLALALCGFIRVPAFWVEAAISLTIVLVAVENLLSLKYSSRWKIAIAIGLIHGLGFANALTNFEFSFINFLKAVIGFNVGVEAGQMIIIASVYPWFEWLRKTNQGARWLSPIGSLGVLIVAAIWFLQRLDGIISQ